MNFKTQFEVAAVYHGNSAEITVALYKLLERYGAAGIVAMNLMRANKASERAKRYRGGNAKGSYRQQAYDKKAWSLRQLVMALQANDVALKITWGWGVDLNAVGFENVLYVELPNGHVVGFHGPDRGAGPAYEKPFKKGRLDNAQKIIDWVGRIISKPPKEQGNDERSTTGTR